MEEQMTQFKKEGQLAFPVENKENDNSSSSSEVEETDDQQTDSSNQDKETDEKKENAGETTNFADHPRWKERENDWKERFNEQEKRHTEDLAKIREEVSAKLDEVKKPSKSLPEKVPSWFGGDEEQWKEYKDYHQSEINRAKEEARNEAIKDIESKNYNENKLITEATKYFREQIKEIEAETGDKVDQNKLLEFVRTKDMTDSKGRWNYKAGFELLKAQSTAKSNSKDDRKKLANATTSDKKTETKPKTYLTSEDFKNPNNRPW